MAIAAIDTFARLARKVDSLMRGLPVHTPAVEAEDVQGLVLRGYGSLPYAVYPLLHFKDRKTAALWLKRYVARIARGRPHEAGAQTEALQIAFTPAGLAALGLTADELHGFSSEFLSGMVGPHRSRFLGDVDESAPEHWRWGGPKTDEVHALLMVFAKTKARLSELQAELRQSYVAHGVSEISVLDTAELSRTEHFGFVDGISQPAIDGYHSTESRLHKIKPGEFLLGYPNEYGLYTERPLLSGARDPRGILPLDAQGSPQRDFGRNGTYLVLRQLRQNVPLFRETLDKLTRRTDGSSNKEAQAYLAAQMVGRWPSGASLFEAPHADDVSKAHANEFRYQALDPVGARCPIGSHVRRANPRDALPPHEGTEYSLEVNRHHRLLRRGRSYGKPLPEGQVDQADRGLMFVAINANISRQFEFIQHSWLNDPRFNGLSGQADPIVGASNDNQFAPSPKPVSAYCTGLPRFVTVTGGGYFFMPGIRALRFLSELTP
jgi:Dyp-type peroxidase family